MSDRIPFLEQRISTLRKQKDRYKKRIAELEATVKVPSEIIADYANEIADLEHRLSSAEMLLNRIGIAMMSAGIEAKKDSLNPLEKWLDDVAQWKAEGGEG